LIKPAISWHLESREDFMKAKYQLAVVLIVGAAAV